VATCDRIQKRLADLEAQLLDAEDDLAIAGARARGLRLEIDDLRKHLPPVVPSTVEAGTIPNLTLLKTRGAAVLEVLRSTRSTMTINEVLAALQEGGRQRNDSYAVVATTLHNLHVEGKVSKMGRGRYRHVS